LSFLIVTVMESIVGGHHHCLSDSYVLSASWIMLELFRSSTTISKSLPAVGAKRCCNPLVKWSWNFSYVLRNSWMLLISKSILLCLSCLPRAQSNCVAADGFPSTMFANSNARYPLRNAAPACRGNQVVSKELKSRRTGTHVFSLVRLLIEEHLHQLIDCRTFPWTVTPFNAFT